VRKSLIVLDHNDQQNLGDEGAAAAVEPPSSEAQPVADKAKVEFPEQHGRHANEREHRPAAATLKSNGLKSKFECQRLSHPARSEFARTPANIRRQPDL
jgi:hypothetical protein